MTRERGRIWLVPAALCVAGLACWGWLRARPAAPIRTNLVPPIAQDHPEPTVLPQAIRPDRPQPTARTAEEAAREAVAEALGGYVVRCALPRVEGRVFTDALLDRTSDISEGFVTRVVDASKGRQVLHTRPESSPTAMPAADAWLAWNDARPGVVNPCTVERGRRYRTRIDVELPPDADRTMLTLYPCGAELLDGEPPWDVEVLGGWPEVCVYQLVVGLADGRVVVSEPVRMRPEDVPATLRLELTEPERPRVVVAADGADAFLAAPPGDPDTAVAIALERDDLDDATRAVLAGWRRSEVERTGAEKELLRRLLETEAGP